MIITAGSVLIGVLISNHQLSQQPVAVRLPASPAITDQVVAVGIIRSCGLNESEKQKLDLSDVAYQLTDFSKNSQQEVSGYYLISDDKSIESFVGKCVQITGTEPLAWKNNHQNNSYLRAPLVLNSLNPIDSTECSPYSEIPYENIAGTEILTLHGTISTSNRPAPDINYDYQIMLSTPFIDKNDSSGSPRQINIINAVPADNNIWQEVENCLNQPIEVQGYLKWGYAESKYFSIISINKNSFNTN